MIARVILLMLVLPIWASAQARSSKQSGPQEIPATKNEPAQDQEIASELRAITSELRAIREQTARTQEQQSQHKPEKGPPVYSNWFLVGVASLAGFLAWRTLSAIERQVTANTIEANATRQATKVAAIALRHSEDSVLNAQAALDASIAASRLDQRAWVGIRELSRMKPENGKPLVLKGTINNSGRTPALYVEFRWHLQTSLIPIGVAEFTATSDQDVSHLAPSRGTLFPNGEQGFGGHSDLPVSTEELAALLDGRLLIYVFGKIIYQDIFGDGHKTTFAFQWAPPDVLNVCDSYNEAS